MKKDSSGYKKKAVVIFLFIMFSCFSTMFYSDDSVKALGLIRNKVDLSEDVEFYALIVGVEKFKGVVAPEEDCIDETAIAMYDLLLNTSNWKEENIKMLLNENATKDKIHDAIVNWLDDLEDENDIVLIFFTGHGWKLPFWQLRYGHSSVFTYNLTEDRLLEDRITDKEFDSWVDELDSSNIAIILETCYSGRMFALRQSGRVLLTAGGRFFFCGVDESDQLGLGIFAYFLFQGFNGVADLNNDGWVTAEEVFHYARRPTIHFSIWKQFPFYYPYNNSMIFWLFQIPFMYDRHLGSIPLVQYCI